MSTVPNQPENLQSDAKPEDPSPDQPTSESPEVEEEEEEEEGECPLCIFVKGGDCKDTFIDWQNCIKEAEDKKEDVVEKCSQVITSFMQCMVSHSDYYEPMIRAFMPVEEKPVIEPEKEIANYNQHEAPSQSNQT